MFSLLVRNPRNRPYWYALKPWWNLIKHTDNPICLGMCVGCGSHSWQRKKKCFWFLADHHYRNTNISPWLVIALRLPQMLLVLWIPGVLAAFNYWSPFLLAGVFENLRRMVFFLLYGWNLLAALSTCVSQVLLCPVVRAEVWCWESWLLLYPVAGDASWWTVGGEELCSVWGQLCLGSLLFIIITMKAKAFSVYARMLIIAQPFPTFLWLPSDHL